MIESYFINKQRDKLKGRYHGVVVETFDDKGANRIKVSLNGLTDTIPFEDLPYYRVSKALVDSPNTSVSIPPVGSKVVVELKGDIYNAEVIETLTNIAPL